MNYIEQLQKNVQSLESQLDLDLKTLVEREKHIEQKLASVKEYAKGAVFKADNGLSLVRSQCTIDTLETELSLCKESQKNAHCKYDLTISFLKNLMSEHGLKKAYISVDLLGEIISCFLSKLTLSKFSYLKYMQTESKYFEGESVDVDVEVCEVALDGNPSNIKMNADYYDELSKLIALHISGDIYTIKKRNVMYHFQGGDVNAANEAGDMVSLNEILAFCLPDRFDSGKEQEINSNSPYHRYIKQLFEKLYEYSATNSFDDINISQFVDSVIRQENMPMPLDLEEIKLCGYIR